VRKNKLIRLFITEDYLHVGIILLPAGIIAGLLYQHVNNSAKIRKGKRGACSKLSSPPSTKVIDLVKGKYGEKGSARARLL
jgi:hypothetical protein